MDLKKYEAMFVLDTGWAGKEWEPAEAELRKILERFGAQVEELTKWAERRLAYEIKKHKRAVYAHVLFHMDPERVSELRAHCGLDERILRLLILAFDPEAQTHLAPEERPGFRTTRRPAGDKERTSPPEPAQNTQSAAAAGDAPEPAHSDKPEPEASSPEAVDAVAPVEDAP